MINGAWVLPQNDEHAALFQQLAKTTRDQGGHATVFNVTTADGEDQAIVERFRADRAREYAEFATRSEGLLEEVDKETRLQKFTFAELEEIEDDLAKLAVWLTKITTRDLFPNEQVESARQMLRRCEQAQIQFAERVYAHEGLEADDENNP